jgi:hypothetical protein
MSGLIKTGVDTGGSTNFVSGGAGIRNAGTAKVDAVEANTGAQENPSAGVAELPPLRPKSGFWKRGPENSGFFNSGTPDDGRLEAGSAG